MRGSGPGHRGSGEQVVEALLWFDEPLYSLAREAADRESFLLALHAISLVPYRHEGLLSRGVEGEDCEGDRGWTAGSYVRVHSDHIVIVSC